MNFLTNTLFVRELTNLIISFNLDVTMSDITRSSTKESCLNKF